MVFLCWGWYLFGHRDGVGGGTFVLVCNIEGPFYFCYRLEKMIDNIWLFFHFFHTFGLVWLFCVTMNEWMNDHWSKVVAFVVSWSQWLFGRSIDRIDRIRNASWLAGYGYLCFYVFFCFSLCRTLFIRFCMCVCVSHDFVDLSSSLLLLSTFVNQRLRTKEREWVTWPKNYNHRGGKNY